MGGERPPPPVLLHHGLLSTSLHPAPSLPACLLEFGEGFAEDKIVVAFLPSSRWLLASPSPSAAPSHLHLHPSSVVHDDISAPHPTPPPIRVSPSSTGCRDAELPGKPLALTGIFKAGPHIRSSGSQNQCPLCHRIPSGDLP